MVTIQASLVAGDLGGLALGLSPLEITVVGQLLIAIAATMISDSLSRASLLPGLAYFVAFALSAWRPSWVLLFTGLSNGLVAVYAFALWFPDARGQLLPRRPPRPP